ncbi:MAG: ISAzo13 family transposase [Actinobacteria bacterium]|nr:ISAzo13 family transposase [Actinomycetota bacterium]MCA1699034.1 ISAzo13 family transposase [Actinomycetota bacterium]
MVDERAIAERYRLLSEQRVLDERGRRLWAAAEARSVGHGGIAAVVRATGISESTVLRGLADLECGEVVEPGRVRRPGAGQVPILEREPGLWEDLERLVDPVTRGDPESPLRWTSKSAAKLAEGLREKGHDVVDRTVLRLLKAKGYSMQANKKTKEGASHPDRDAQFAHINQTVAEAIAAGQPVISVDTKKRELVGDFKAVGREFEPSGRPVEVRGHDFKDKQLGHAIPYGVYDLCADEGWVSVGVTRDTATFAVNSILSWWQHLGRERYPDARTLTITADSGGSNSPRTKLWRVELQRLADETGLEIRVCHFPAGTSKWNKIEHRMFSFVSLNWRGKPLESLEVIVNLIAATTTNTGLKVYARLDDREYEKGVEVTDEQLAAVNITRGSFHGEWNYVITHH